MIDRDTDARADPPVRPEPDERHPAPIAWPPPGLERVHADLAPATRRLALGGMALALPLLWAIGTPQPPWSPGRFGLDWWIVAAVALHGAGLLGSGWYALFRLARRAATALDRGYGWITIALVTTDVPHDAGFVLQGAREFSTLGAVQRRHLLRARLLAAAGLAVAAIWIPFGFALAVLLATAGVLGMVGLWLVALGPSIFLLALAALARAAEGTLTRDARRAWYKRPWSQDLERAEVDRWKEALADLDGGSGLGAGSSGHGRAVRAGAVACLLTGLLALLPPVALVGVSSVSAILAQMGTPRFSQAMIRTAVVEPLRDHVLDPDPEVTPRLAGEALHALSFVGRTHEPDRHERAPVRQYAQDWVPEGASAGDRRRLQAESLELIRNAASGLTVEDRRLLTSVAAHPAHAEFELLARAASLDAAAASFPLPLPQGLQIMDLPTPRLAGVQMGASAHLAKAALELADGRPDRAERAIREVISVGVLLSDHGYMLIENLAGQRVAGLGGDALATFFEVTGRESAGATMRAMREAAETAGARVAAISAAPDPGALLARLPQLVTDPTLPRGLRWQLFTDYNTLGPCTNMHHIVFGPGTLHGEWIEESRASLVRFESEAELFELARGGWFATNGKTEAEGVVNRLLMLPFREHGPAASCGHLFAGLSAAL